MTPTGRATRDTLTDTAARLGQANDVSGGFVEVGRRQYTLRFTGRYEPRHSWPTWCWNGATGGPSRLGDIAEIQGDARGEQRRTAHTQNGNPGHRHPVWTDKENSANALQTLNAVKAVVEELNAGPVQESRAWCWCSPSMPPLFINRAINLVA